ncbi:MAG: PqiC family protein [Pseudomonadota bacterium]
MTRPATRYAATYAATYVTRIATLAALVVLLLAGCATPANEHYYRLAYPAGELAADTASAGGGYELIVDSVRIPEAINRPQLVVQKSATESLISDDQRWVAPLDEQIAQTIVANLRRQLPGVWSTTGAITSAGAGPGLPRYHLKIQVEQLLIESGGKVALEAIWVLQDSSRKMVKSERAVINVALNGPGYDAIAPAVSEAVRQLSVMVAKGISSAR